MCSWQKIKSKVRNWINRFIFRKNPRLKCEYCRTHYKFSDGYNEMFCSKRCYEASISNTIKLYLPDPMPMNSLRYYNIY